MAERKQTAGTVLNRLGGMGTFYNPNQQAIASAIRSGSLDRQDVQTLAGFQRWDIGSKGYQSLYPEVFGGMPQMPRAMSPYAMQIAALQALKNSFIGVGMEIYRTMINNQIASIRERHAGQLRGMAVRREQDFPLPDWMRPILGLPPLEEGDAGMGRGRDPRRGERTPTMSAEELRGLKISPLGAQTELDVDQQKYLSSFLTWQKAGAPSGTEGGGQFLQTLQRMSQGQGDYWTEFQRKSQGMFPQSGRLGVQRRIASQ
jgi:hypothetical protein